MKQIARLILLLAFSLFFSQAASAQITIEWESGPYTAFSWVRAPNGLIIGVIQQRRFLVTSGSGYIDVTATLDATGNSVTTRMWVEEGIEFRAELKLDFVVYPPIREASAGESCWTVIFDSEAADVPGSSTFTAQIWPDFPGFWCPTAVAISAQVDEFQLNASDGTFTDHVRVTWNEVEGATAYQVFRCTTASEDSCGDAVGSPDGNGFDDYDGIDDVHYWYRVKACTGGDCGDFSEADEGDRSDGLDDHGNSCVAATPVAVNSTTSGVIEEREILFVKDLDYFSVELLSPGTLTVSSSGTTTVRGTLWDTECNSIATNVGFFNSPNFLISEQLAEGDYFVSVEGVISTVWGPYQFVSSFETSSALPEPPTEVSASDGGYYDAILVSWSAVSFASSYNVYYSEEVTSTRILLKQTTDTSAFVTGLENGVQYFLWVSSVNANGESENARFDWGHGAARTVPYAPTLTSAEPGHQDAVLNFTANHDGGFAITGYTASCGAFSQAGSSSPITVGGLTNGVEYSCSVIATNAEGDSASSNVLSVTPIPKELIYSDGFEAKTN